MSDHVIDRLSDYLDDELGAGERGRIDDHLASCASCADELAALAAIVTAAGQLEDTPPERDLWPAIEARLTPHEAVVIPLETRRLPRRISFSMTQLVAAAMAFLILGAAATWFARIRDEGGGTLPVADATVGAPAADAASTVLVSDRDDPYRSAVEELEAVFEANRDRGDSARAGRRSKRCLSQFPSDENRTP